MSYLDLSRSFNVQNLSNKQLLEFIKNNEYYSSCFWIIQEKNLKGIDVQNLSENSLAGWKLPQWLAKKLLSLKETISTNHDLLSSEVEENFNDYPKKAIADTLSTIFKNQQRSKLPFKKPDKTSQIKKESGLNLIYDEGNYLKPNLKHFQKGPTVELKQEQLRSSSIESHDILNRKPIALPRPGVDEEQNDYELPPRGISNFNKAISKLPLPPPPDEESIEYEAAPGYAEELVESNLGPYEVIPSEKEEKSKSFGTPSSQFYLPPPPPEILFAQKTQAEKHSSTFDKNNTSRVRKMSPKISKLFPSATLDTKSNEMKTRWSTTTRPLPPLPTVSNDHVTNKKKAELVTESEDEEAVYENAHDETPDTEELPEYGNVVEPPVVAPKSNKNTELKSNTHRELQERFEKRQRNKEFEGFTNSALAKSGMKLPLPPSVPTSIHSSFFDQVKDSSRITNHSSELNSNDEEKNSDDEQPEYSNAVDPRKKTSSWKSHITSPLVQRTFGIHSKGESDFEDQEQDDEQPEYSNTADTNNKPSPKKSQMMPSLGFRGMGYHHNSSTQEESDFDEEEQDTPHDYPAAEQHVVKSTTKRSEHHPQAHSDLFSQIKTVKLKSIPKKDNLLNDNAAAELRILLAKRKGSAEGPETKDLNSGPRKISSSKSVHEKTNYDSVHMEHEDTDDLEQENYDFPGSYAEEPNFNNEPFYRNTDRKGAIALLKDLENGAFLLRPSRKFFLSLTIKNNGKYFNLGIEKTPSNKIFCGEGMMRTKEFYSLQKFLQYFEFSPLVLQGEKGLEEVYLKKVLPPDRF